MEFDLYDYECHDYDTDATTTWLATTSAEAEGDTSFSFVRQDQETAISMFDERDQFHGDNLEEEHNFLLETRRCEDEKPIEPLLHPKDDIKRKERIPPVACLDDLEIWDG